MLFLRMGPRLIFLRTYGIEQLEDFLKENLNGREVDFYPGMEEASEDSSLIFITDPHPIKTEIKDAKTIILINQPASICLATIINSHVSQLVERVEMGPSSMVMRIAGKETIVAEQLLELYNGKDLSLEEAVNEGEQGDTILFLTHRQLSEPLGKKDLLEPPLLLHQASSQVFKKLRNEGILYITQSLEDRKWYEVRVNIYDVQGNYDKHYERLIHVLYHLEAGMVLEEVWTRDHALSLFTVLAYQVRLFTLYKPQELKEILIGLEFDESGKRLVDLDLYYRNKKISWVDIDKEKKKRNKIQEGIEKRQGLLEKMSKTAKEKLLAIENKSNN
ncbi:hypothetical protein SAMN05660297_01384 [Natronincola peptidivorans]|uniref:Uncharacterized protein n=1 Tax=Natronincola peptidivorans TaxID=426128 RepID=A0A1I0BSW2_9FIRM|nr:hypothetical protein [Natronincola peptidivorans]SET09432.1 hypothetical protein SAMN05660297_01384 [Natronincola peptidivorans]